MATASVSLIDNAKVQKIQNISKPFSNLFQMLKLYRYEARSYAVTQFHSENENTLMFALIFLLYIIYILIYK